MLAPQPSLWSVYRYYCSTDLKVGRRNTSRQLIEQWRHYLWEFRVFDHIQYLLQFVKEHHLWKLAFNTSTLVAHRTLWRVCLWPVLQQADDNGLGEGWIFLEELDDTIRQLWMVHRERFDLVQWEQDAEEEYLVRVRLIQFDSSTNLVLLFKWQGKSVDNWTQDLEQLGNAIVTLSLVNEAVENVVDLKESKPTIN